MIDIWLVSFMQFRKRNQNVTTNVYIFNNKQEALSFADSLEPIQLAKVTKHYVWNSYQFALRNLNEENEEYEKIDML